MDKEYLILGVGLVVAIFWGAGSSNTIKYFLLRSLLTCECTLLVVYWSWQLRLPDRLHQYVLYYCGS